MKRLIISSAFALLSVLSYSQNAKKDATGNYVALHKASAKSEAKATGKTFTDAKGKTYPVFVTSNDKLYIIRTSKNGNEYKMYLKL